jgi:hypothetical protein
MLTTIQQTSNYLLEVAHGDGCTKVKYVKFPMFYLVRTNETMWKWKMEAYTN